MNDNLNQPERDDTPIGNPAPGIYGPLGNQGFSAGADSSNEFAEYEVKETPVPYLGLPSESRRQPAQQSSPASVAKWRAANSPSSSPLADTAAAPARKATRGIKWIYLLLISCLLSLGLVFLLEFVGIIQLPPNVYHLVLILNGGVLLLSAALRRQTKAK